MALTIHFISGLPRSGSTLLAAILRQNPKFHAAISTPLGDIFSVVLRTMSSHEGALFISNQQRRCILTSLVDGYYKELSDRQVIFDTSRMWCNLLPAIAELFPTARTICCIRNPAWILDSVERLVQRNSLLASKMFSHDVKSVYDRVEVLMKNGFVGNSLHALRQAWFSEEARRLIGIRYESLAEAPADVVANLYRELGEPTFEHDFEHLEYSERDFDDRLGMPGLHNVAHQVRAQKRETILPPELFNQYNRNFWELMGQNPRGVKVL